MSATQLTADDIGLPVFNVNPTANASVFSLSSHARARDALDLALLSPSPQHNVFVLGPEQAGRMTATVDYLRNWAREREAASDWVYLIDFDQPHRPRPLALAAGTGHRLREVVSALMPELASIIANVLTSEGYASEMQLLRQRVASPVESESEALGKEAQAAGFALVATPQGPVLVAQDESGQPIEVESLPEDERAALAAKASELAERVGELQRAFARVNHEIQETSGAATRKIIGQAIAPAIASVGQEFAEFASEGLLTDWLTRLAEDVTDRHGAFLRVDGELPVADASEADHRYGVNLLVDRVADKHMPVVLEQHPTYENLFGKIEYRQGAGGALDTDVSLIRAGSLHRANGGILLLRAEDIASNVPLWNFLQAALRDSEIRIEEFYRSGAPPLAEAPVPQPVPLKVRVVLVGSAAWYYSMLSMAPSFNTLFKIKAHIDDTADATPENLGCYSWLLAHQAKALGVELTDEAISFLLGIASRWAGHRGKLAAAFESLLDLAVEAGIGRTGPLTAEHLHLARTARTLRISQIEDQVHRSIRDQQTIIEVDGAIVGQINGLTVQNVGDHSFGAPARITARSSVGREGIINIERQVAMSGPIQQKGTLVLQGILSRLFARSAPLSFNCSVTFEQLYGGVEGDSASLAEFIAIISDLAELPIRQDIAITGSVNQLGEAQVIGGVHHKIEGFYRACIEQGGLSGTQGVVVPVGNLEHLVVGDDIQEAVSEGLFHIWSVGRVEEAVELFTGMQVGEADDDEGTVYGRVARALAGFDEALRERRL